MKYFFRRTAPRSENILVVESGSPQVTRKALEGMRRIFPEARYHLLTCWPVSDPSAYASVHRASDSGTWRDKLRLLMTFRRKRWEILALLCTGEPVLRRWKVMALLLLPAKVLIVNENGDFFWLDWDNRKALRQFLAIRWGGSQGEILRTLGRALVFPLTLLFLLLGAGWLYARRARRLLVWRIRGEQTFSLLEEPPALPAKPDRETLRPEDPLLEGPLERATNPALSQGSPKRPGR